MGLLLHSARDVLLKPTTSPTKAISEVLFYTKQVQTKAMRDGIESESNIIHAFENETGQKVHKYDFNLSEKNPFLGASPDGVINDSEIVEVKKVVTQNLFLLTLYFGRVCFQNLSNSILIMYLLNLFIHEIFMNKQGGTRTCSF